MAGLRVASLGFAALLLGMLFLTQPHIAPADTTPSLKSGDTYTPQETQVKPHWPAYQFSPTQDEQRDSPPETSRATDGKQDSAEFFGSASAVSVEVRKDAAFRKLYPTYYLETLKDWQNFVLRTDAAHSTSFAFQNEGEVSAFLGGFIDYNERAGLIQKESAHALHAGLTGAFKEAKEREAAHVSFAPESEHFVWLKKLLAYLLPEKAFAIIWNTFPQCYKNTGPAGPGTTLFAPTCNGGFSVDGIPIPDCGPGGVACVVPAGCLNAVCAGRPNAIFDPTTGMCGCG